MSRDYRRGSAPARNILANSSLISPVEQDEINQRGYLNRKVEGTMGRKTKVLHRERNWQLLWCNLKGTQLEFYKVDGVKVVKLGDPPPRDIYPPRNMLKTKVDQLDLDDALVEVDYVSQEKKDIQKRRKYLFHVVLKNDMEYLMQACSENQRSLWVTVMQRAASNVQIQPEDSVIGHAIKTSRDSIKHTSKQTVHRSIIPTNIPTDLKIFHPVSMSAPGNEDSDYVEFSMAESITASGGDPRLQGLRKRLQAKKELLKQLDRMYSSFLGGNAAAMYDDTLILQQLEPPTFDCGSPILSTDPDDAILKRSARKTSRKVLHRKLTLSDSTAKSVDRGIDEIDESGERSEDKDMIDRRASTGEMSVPTVITSMTSLPHIQDEVLETELLKDYYLVPGADWSLIKKGETVEIIGKAKETGWYRCMALREAKIELDRSPFSFIIKSMINLQSSKGKSGITPEMIEEEYSESLSSAANVEYVGSDSSVTPPPLMPKSCPPGSPLGSTNDDEDIFQVEMKTLSEDVEEEDNTHDTTTTTTTKDGEICAVGNNDVPTTDEGFDQQHYYVSRKTEFINGLEGTELYSLEEEKSNERSHSPDSVENAAEEGTSDVVLREEKQSSRVKRPLSYELATGEIQTLDSYIKNNLETEDEETAKETSDQIQENGKKQTTISNQIKRSTSFTPTAIKLRNNLNPAKNPRAVSVGMNYDQPTTPDSATRNSAYYSLKSFSSPQSRLDRLIEKELTTGTYPSPLIGCIPPSALKCFAQKEEKKEGNSPHPTSPTPSQSDTGGSIGTENADSAPSSRPVSDQIDTTSDQNDTAEEKKVPVNFERKESNSTESKEKSNTGTIMKHRFSMSISLDDDSDGEADRRQANIFKSNIVIKPEEDASILKTRKHIRAKSLPPPLHVRVIPPLQPEEDASAQSNNLHEDDEESSLDVYHLRRHSPDHNILPCHSVGSSPIHNSNTPTIQQRALSPSRSFSKGSTKSGSEIGGLFDSNKPGLLKKLFARKKGTKLNTPNVPSGRISPGPPPGMLKQILLGNLEDSDTDIFRARVSSMSGRPVHQVGMAIVIGDESSSESEGEEESYLLSSYASSFQEESSQGMDIPSNGRSTPDSPPIPENTNILAAKNNRLVTDSPIVDAIFDISPRPALSKLKRSASEHDSIKLKASLACASNEDDPINQVGSTSSLKRNTSAFGKKPRKQLSMTSQNDSTSSSGIKKNRLSRKKKKRPLSAYAIENDEVHIPGSTEHDPAIKISGIFRQPPRGEKRYVYLDPSKGKYGFRLQSYGRIKEQGKVLQTFVESVIPGSPSFMAGLYPGDAIVEVNGMDVRYAPVEDVVEAIQKGTVTGERVALKVEFVDGVTRLDHMKKSDGYKNEIKALQNRLKEILDSDKSNPPTFVELPSPQHIVLSSEVPKWADIIPDTDVGSHTHPYNRYLNEIVAVHSGNIRGLDCDTLVMPISSCHKAKDITDKNILLQLLRSGGPGLLDDLSLAKQCKIGENIVTWGHALSTKYIYHCVFGDLEESLQSCCYRAMEVAHKESLRTIVFWLDGFASLSVSPHIIIEAVRNWLQQNNKRNVFERVIFSSKANSSLVEKLMHKSFPLFPSATRDSGSNESIENGGDPLQNETDTSTKGTRALQNGNEEAESTNGEINSHDVEIVLEENGSDNRVGNLKEGDDSNTSTEEMLELLQEIQDNTMRTFEELIGQFEDCDTNSFEDLVDDKLTSPLDVFSHDMPGDHDHLEVLLQGTTSRHSRSLSGDMILNPRRTESEV